MQPKTFGKVNATNEVSDNAKGASCDHHGHDGQPVQAVGQVHRIGSADDHKNRKWNEHEAKVDQNVLEHRHSQLARQIGGMILRCPIARNGCDQQAQQDAHAA